MEKKQEIDSVVRHVNEAIRGGIAELHGDKKLAQQLNAATRLRLVTMSDQELMVLAKLLSPSLGKTAEEYYKELKQTVEEHRKTADEWTPALRGDE